MIPLKEEVGAAIAIAEDERMPRFAGIPTAGGTIAEEGLIAEPLPGDAIVARGATDLLGAVVVGTAIEHEQYTVVLVECWCLDALLLPWQGWRKDRAIAELAPIFAPELARGGGCCNAEHLNAHLWIAGGVVEQRPIAKQHHISIDRSATVPFASWPEDRVGWVALEGDTIMRSGMADTVVPTIAIGLVEQVHHTSADEHAGCTESALFVGVFGADRTDWLPVIEIVALGNPDRPTIRLAAIAIWRQGIVQQVATAEPGNGWIFGKWPPTRMIGKIHRWCGERHCSAALSALNRAVTRDSPPRPSPRAHQECALATR